MPTEANPEPEPTFPRLTNQSLPINTVRKLLEEAKGLFDNIVYYWDQLLFKRSFRQRLRDAWGELRDILANLATELSDTITETVQNGLRRVGFDGNQLKLKVDTLTEIWSRFHENGLPFLKDLLEYLSVCFDSLAKVFPQLEAVKELVDAVKWYLSPSEKWAEVK